MRESISEQMAEPIVEPMVAPERPRFIEPPRRPILATVLLAVYLTAFGVVAAGVYRIAHVTSLIAQSSPINQIDARHNLTIASTRRALRNGPRGQRIEIIRAIGSPELPAYCFLDDLRNLIRDPDPQVSQAAIAAVQRIIGEP